MDEDKHKEQSDLENQFYELQDRFFLKLYGHRSYPVNSLKL